MLSPVWRVSMFVWFGLPRCGSGCHSGRCSRRRLRCCPACRTRNGRSLALPLSVQYLGVPGSGAIYRRNAPWGVLLCHGCIPRGCPVWCGSACSLPCRRWTAPFFPANRRLPSAGTGCHGLISKAAHAVFQIRLRQSVAILLKVLDMCHYSTNREMCSPKL